MSQLLLSQAELLLEPTDHPVAPVDLNLQGVGSGDGAGVWWDEGNDLDVAAAGGVDGGRGAVGEAGDVRLHTTGAYHLTRLVGGGGDEGETGRDARLLGGLGGDLAQNLGGRNQLGEQSLVHRHRLPLPVRLFRPGQSFVVKGHIAHLAAHAVHEAAHQSVGQVAGEVQVFVRALPYVRLESAEPVGLGLRLEIGNRLGHPAQAKGQPPEAAHRRQSLGAALVQPDDGRTQGIAVLVHVDQR